MRCAGALFFRVNRGTISFMAKYRKPSPDQLKPLYQLMGSIKALEPWNRLWDMNLTCIELPGMKEPVFCSVMGRNGECYGIGVYPGWRSLSGLLRMAENNDPPFSVLEYMDCLSCYFGNREELLPDERKTIKELGLSFRGKNNWPYFRRSRPNCMPWEISDKNAVQLKEILEQFITAYECLADKKLSVDFEKDFVLYRGYSKKTKTWITESRPMPPVTGFGEGCIIQNEIFTGALKMKPSNGLVLEVGTVCVPVSVGKTRDGFPALMRVVVLMYTEQNVVVDQYLLKPNDDTVQETIRLLADFIEARGRPACINVRNDWAYVQLEDFCRKTGIDLSSEGVPRIDEFSNEFLNSGIFR
jgi:hypothetical protein